MDPSCIHCILVSTFWNKTLVVKEVLMKIGEKIKLMEEKEEKKEKPVWRAKILANGNWVLRKDNKEEYIRR